MRSRKEIDTEYSGICMQYGDKIFKQALLQEEIKELFKRMAELSHEPAAADIVPVPALGADSSEPLTPAS